ncbi:MAG: alpha/beta fold hydrolase [Hyphomicrobiales bacterium]|nr:alpha/beta fold hydrolase [Hyphomicrobiales bacterium]
MSIKGIHSARAGIELAWQSDGPQGTKNGPTGFFWLGGLMSDMTGSKAQVLAELAQKTGRNCIRFDYSGHGASGGAFRNGTISKWLDEALQMFTTRSPGPRIVIGSSMGGWLALLLAKHLNAQGLPDAGRIAGMVLIAPAADMTRDLMWNSYGAEVRQKIEQQGYYEEPSEYGPEPYIITRDLIEDGKQHLLLHGIMEAPFPVRILQGEQDPDVPWQHGLRVYNALTGPDTSFTLIKSGDHRLSTPRDLETLRRTCIDLCHRADKL